MKNLKLEDLDHPNVDTTQADILTQEEVRDNFVKHSPEWEEEDEKLDNLHHQFISEF